MQELCLFKSQNQLTNFIDSRNFIHSRNFYTFKKLCAPDLRILGKAGYKGDIKGEIKGNSGIDKLSKMADANETTIVEHQLSRQEQLNWDLYFSSLLELVDEYERLWGTNDLASKENIQIRLEFVILSLQQIVAIDTVENRQVLNGLLRNMCLLHEYWIRQHLFGCTDVAIYSLESPAVIKSGEVGRPKYLIHEEVLLQLRSSGFTWSKIASMLLVSRWTVQRRVVEFNLQEVTGFSELSDDELDVIITRFMRNHGTLVGYSLLCGHLRSIGLRVQRDRIRESIARVDPVNSRIRWATVIARRSYRVAGPNSLWHLDGHHSLVTWGFVIHGAIDGFSRLVVFLKCSTNNESYTVANLFLLATERYQWPSRVRTDYGGENVRVWELMEERRGSNRGSYLVGSSTQNQRIERLWRDVFRVVTHIFYYTFHSMEEAGILDRNNVLHLFSLHYVFLPRINTALDSFVEAWNLHPIRTERNWTPEQIWMNGMIDLRNEQLTAVADVAGSVNSVDDLEWYGFDPQAPHPNDDGLSTVLVHDINFEIPEQLASHLTEHINPLVESNSFGIDIYEQVLEIVLLYQHETI